MVRKTLLFALVIGSLISSAPPAAAATEQYVGFTPILVPVDCAGVDMPWGECFAIPAGADSVSISLRDDTTLSVVGWIGFADEDLNVLDTQFVCDDVSRPVPSGAVVVDVVVQDPALYPFVCPGLGPAAATTGVITVTF